jgi:hypothetical protein
MLPSYKRPKVQPFSPPRAIRRLPFNLKRDSLYPRQPARAARAVDEYYRYMDGATMPALLPQRMGFQQWKTNPEGQRRDWLSSAESWSALVNQFTHGVPNRVARKMGTYPHYTLQEAAAVRGANMMPQPPRDLTPVVARTVRQDDATSTMRGRAEPPPSAWAMADEITQMRHRRARLIQQEAALFGARAAVVRARGFVKVR